jgi:hypothetical protein
MQPSTSWQPAIGSSHSIGASQWPIYLPSELRAEWDLVIRAHHNLLLEGASSATTEMLAAMGPYLRQPIEEYTPRAGAPVPQTPEGTLILLEVARLDLEQQIQLLRWLDALHTRLHVQIVSTTCTPLFSLVETGAFLPDLYYRLNVVRIGLNTSAEGSL